MDPRAFRTSQMCVQIERLLQKVTNCEGFCQGLAIGIARARLNQEVFAVSHRGSNPRLRLKARKQGVGAREFLRFATL